MLNKTIYLTGFMGVGKSTIARELGRALLYPFVDTDELITRMEGTSIEKIFSNKGESYFRELESKVLQMIEAGTIVSTGGGIVVKEENRSWMLDSGVVIFLECDIEELWRRIKDDRKRPLAKNKDDVFQLYRNRKSLYQQCHFTIDTTNLTIEETLSHIIKELELN